MGQLHHHPKAVIPRGSATACMKTAFGGATTTMGATEGVRGPATKMGDTEGVPPPGWRVLSGTLALVVGILSASPAIPGASVTSAAVSGHRHQTCRAATFPGSALSPRALSGSPEGAGVPGEERPSPASPCPGLGHGPHGTTTRCCPRGSHHPGVPFPGART